MLWLALILVIAVLLAVLLGGIGMRRRAAGSASAPQTTIIEED